MLWDVILDAKKTAAVVMTTHSMEEAEALCDRIGIFVGGKLSCIGSPQASKCSQASHQLVITPGAVCDICQLMPQQVLRLHLSACPSPCCCTHWVAYFAAIYAS